MALSENQYGLRTGEQQSPGQLIDINNLPGSISYAEGKWQFASQIVDWKKEMSTYAAFRGVSISQEVYELSDGAQHQFHYFQPVNQKTEVPVVFTTPWLTSDRGHNRLTAIDIAMLGYPVIEIGPTGNFNEGLLGEIKRWMFEFNRRFADITCQDLARDAHNIHQMLDANYGQHSYSSSLAVYIGDSKGAMTAMGLKAFEEKHQRLGIYADLIAPCYANGLRLTDLLAYRRQVFSELRALGELALEIPFSKLIQYPDTVNANPKSVAYQIAMLPTLVSGVAGELASAISDKNTKMYITALTGDIAGQGEEWKRILGGLAGVSVEMLDGSHLSLAAKRITAARQLRLDRLISELHRTNDDPSVIKYANIDPVFANAA